MMKKYCIALVAASLLAVSAIAQTSASGSATGNASVQPGQAGASASTNQSVQTPGASVSGDASANAKANEHGKNEHGKKSASSGGAGANAGSASAASVGGAALSSGTTLQAELTKSLDAKKAKAGDEVSARVTQDVKSDGKVVVHKGSRLVGHVTEAKARTKEDTESKLGIVFDKAVLKGGQEVAFNGVIQALAPPAQGAIPLSGDESSGLGAPVGGGGGSARSSGGGALGGVTGAAGSAVGSTVGTTTGAVGGVAGSAGGAVNGTVNNTAGLAANGTLGAASHGVVGLQGLALNTSAVGSAQGSVVSSASKNVKLDSGTQIVLQVAAAAAAH